MIVRVMFYFAYRHVIGVLLQLNIGSQHTAMCTKTKDAELIMSNSRLYNVYESFPFNLILILKTTFCNCQL